MIQPTAAGIVTFNPDIERLKQNIDAIYPQVEHLIIADNASDNKEALLSLLADYENVTLLENETNRGIAAALNRIFKEAYERKLSWVLTLDQDSVCPEHMIPDFFSTNPDSSVGILCPVIVDRNTGILEGCSREEESIERCITSGALTNVAAWKKLRGFDEKMFIDGVDFEFCDRLLANDYKIIRIRKVELIHELGKMTTHRFLGRTVRVQNHNATRKYYIMRNRVYADRKKHKRFYLFTDFCFLLKFTATILFFEKGKTKKIGAVLRGFLDGLKM